ncbi:heavy metal-binding domain-containing protein [Lactiplantibacillus paraxiangfangensis]|uniref:heavy metal-binding domain-containing protein n=1 Tax=Lactiplantibacillus paraxiangfangensis TaxID=3076224 RepID=UPI0030C72778
MKTKEIARNNNLSVDELDDFIEENTKYESSRTAFGSLVVKEDDVSVIIEDFNNMQAQNIAAAKMAQEEAERKAREKAEAAARKQKALREMLITSGFNFDGYNVVKYSGYISGDDAVQVNRGHEGVFASATNVGDALMENLTVIRRNALAELKEQAYALGCNAIIGVDFDYLTLDPETVNSRGGTVYMPYVFGVTANGNAVIIEKS